MIPLSWFCEVCNRVRDGNTSWCRCLKGAGRACKRRPVARRPGALSQWSPSLPSNRVHRDVLALETLSFTVSDDIVCIVSQNSGGPELDYCVCYFSCSVIHHPLREQMKENIVTWCQWPRSSRKAQSDALQIQSEYSHMKNSWFIHWYCF